MGVLRSRFVRSINLSPLVYAPGSKDRYLALWMMNHGESNFHHVHLESLQKYFDSAWECDEHAHFVHRFADCRSVHFHTLEYKFNSQSQRKIMSNYLTIFINSSPNGPRRVFFPNQTISGTMRKLIILKLSTLMK